MNAVRTRVPMPQEAYELMQRVYGIGHEIYAVGGFVRDFFLNKEGGDVDFTTDLLPCEIKSLFLDCRVIETGIKHGTVTVIFKGTPFEITTFRSDGEYLDARHPSSVSFKATLDEDLARRDFTINALCYFECGQDYGIVDLFGGIDDIKRGIIKAIGNPQKRFAEDALRILRGYRFAAQLGFCFDEETRCAAIEASALLARVSFERKLSELFALLGCDKSRVLFDLYQDGVLENVINENPKLSDFDIACVLKAKTLILRMAMLIMNISDETFGALPLDRTIRQLVVLLKQEGSNGLLKDRAVLKKRLFLIGRTRLLLLLEYQAARGIIDCFDEIFNLLDEIFAKDECYTIKQLKISGYDVNCCFSDIKGEQVGCLLRELLFLVIDEKLENQREALLAYIKTRQDKGGI